eukprot:gene4854-5491_t
MLATMSQKGLTTERMGLEFNSEKTWYVTHVEEDSGLFYIHLIDPSISVKYERLYQEIEGAAGSGRLRSFTNVVKVGDVCLAQFSEDEQWYRGQVLSIDLDSEDVEVFFIDYGNSEFMVWKHLKVIPDEFCELPPQALQCRLANIEPVGGVWGKGAVKLLKELILERELKGVPSHLCRSGAIVIKLFADDARQVLVAQQLVMAGFAHWKRSHSSRASSSTPSTASSSGNTLSIKVKPGQLGQIDIKPGKYLDLCVSHYESAEIFFCQPVEHSDDLTAMQDELQSYYAGSQATDLPIASATVGQICCARFSDDQAWYRGIIRSVCENAKFEVQFIDFGNNEILPLKEIKVLSPAFLQLPILALKCCFYGIKAESKAGSFDDFLEKFEELTLEKQLVAHVKEVEDSGIFSLVLLDATGKDEVNVNSELIQAGLASPLCPRNKLSFTSHSKSTSSQSSSQSALRSKYVALNVDCGITEVAYVAFGSNPHDFSCQFAKYSDALENMMEELNKEYQSLKQSDAQLKSVQIGSPCCALYKDDGRYYRAEVLSTSGSKAKVNFVDYGNDDECNLSSLKQLKKEYLKLPKQAFKCRLFGIQPIDNMGTFSLLACTKFIDLVLEREFNLTIVSKQPDGSMEVNLVECNSRNIATFDVAKAMIDSGLAEPQTAISGTKGPIVLNGAYRELKVPMNEYFDVVPTDVTDLGQFCCQMVEQADDIDAMMAALEESYKSSEPKPNISWNIGMPVAAIYPLDGAWYRAVLSGISNGQADVTYVDFGNSERVAMNDVRPLYKDFMKLPAQAFVCRLDDVRPTQGQFWNEAVVDAFSKLVWEKHLIGLVKRKDKSNIHSIELCDTLSNRRQQLNIADVIIEKGLAVRVSDTQQSDAAQAVKPATGTSVKKYAAAKLTVGDVEQVYVSHVDDLGNFYCQLQRLEGQLDEVMNAVADACENSDPLSSVNALQPVCAMFSEDEAWYRAEVMQTTTNSSARVSFVDYGNSEVVHVSKMRPISNDLLKEPKFAINCSLHTVHDAKWKEDAVTEFTDRTVDKVVKMSVKDMQSNGKFVVELFVESGQSIAEDLSIAVAESSSSLETGYPSQSIVTNVTEEFYVTHVDALSDLYVQLASKCDALDVIMFGIDECGKEKIPSIRLKSGLPCVAQFSEDAGWYRGVVERCDGAKAVIRFIDYGNVEEKPVSEIYQLMKEHATDPPFATRCFLQGAPVNVPAGDLEKFKEAVLDKAVKGKFIGKTDGKYELVLDGFDFSKAATNNITVAAIKVLPGSNCDCYVSHTESLEEFYVQLNENVPDLDQVAEKMAEIGANMAAYSDLTNPAVGVYCCARFSEDGAWYRAKIEEISSDSCKVRFIDYGNTDMVNPAELKAIPADIASLSPKLAIRCKLHGNINNSDSDIEKFVNMSLDQLVCISFVTASGDNSHIVKVQLNGEDLNGVFTRAVVPITVLESESESGTKAQAQQASKKPSICSPDVIMEYEEHKLKPGDALYNVVVAYVDHTEIYCQLTSEMEKLDDIMNMLESHYGSLDSTQQKFQKVSSGMPCVAKFTDGSWYRGVVHCCKNLERPEIFFVDYGNVEPVVFNDVKEPIADLFDQPMFALKCGLAGMDWAERDVESESYLLEKAYDMKIKYVDGNGKYMVELFDDNVRVCPSKSFENVTLNTGDIERVYVISADSPSEFYCHLVRYEDELNALLDDIAQQARTLKQLNQPTDGQPCMGLFSEDQCWYRGVITETQSDKCKVFFVDYANEEWVANSNIKEITNELLQKLPIQAVKCCLSVVKDGSDCSAEELETWKSLCAGEDVLSMSVVSSTDSSGLVKVILASEFVGDDKLSQAAESVVATKSYKDAPVVSGSTFEACCYFVKSARVVCCQLMSLQQQLDALMEDIATYCNSAASSSHVPAVGSACLALFEDGTWYRARVQSVNETSGNVSVYFVDYGNEASVASSDLREIRNEDLELPITCVECHVADSLELSADEEDVMPILEDICYENTLCVEVHKITSPGVVHGDVSVKGGQNSIREILMGKFPVENAEESEDPAALAPALTIKEPQPAVHDIQKFQMPADFAVEKSIETFCTFITTSAELCCQPVDTQEKLDVLMDEISTHCSGNDDYLKDPAVGQACLAKYPVDEGWYRAEVTATDKVNNTATVYFVDYGNAEELAVSNHLLSIPSEFTELGVCCIAVSIAGFRASLGSVDQVKTWLEEKCVEKTLLLSDLAALDGFKYQGRVQVVESSLDVNEAVAGEFGEKGPEKEAGKMQYSGELEMMMREIAEYCDSTSRGIPNLAVGQACLGRYPIDGQWYRAEALSFTDDQVKLRYVDYDNEAEVSFSDIRETKPEFTKLPSLGFACLLHDVHREGLNQDAAKLWLEQSCLDKEYNVEFVSVEAGRIEVNMFYLDSEETVNDELYASFAFEDISETQIEQPTDSVPPETPPQPVSPPSAIDTDENAESAQMEESTAVVKDTVEGFDDVVSDDVTMMHFSSPEIDCNQAVSVVFTHVDDRDLTVHFQLSQYVAELDTLMGHIADHCAEVTSAPAQRDVACFAQLLDDLEWYRAEIIAREEGNAARVLFVDYGNCATVAAEQLRAIDHSYMVLPKVSVACVVEGTSDINESAEVVKSWMEECLFDKNIELTVLEALQDGSFKVSLRVGGIDFAAMCICQFSNLSASSMDNDISETAQKVITPDQAVSEPDELAVPDESVVSIEPVLQDESVELPSSIEPRKSVDSSTKPQDDDQSKCTIAAKKITVDACLAMHLSLATSPSSFWCQFDETSQDLLQLMSEINQAASLGQLEDFQSPPTVGSFCCAEFAADNQWYRGEIVNMCTYDGGDREFLVKFIDYGNVEKVSIDKIKILDARHYSLHRQCVECSLHAVKPVAAVAVKEQHDATWSDESIAEFEHACAEKLLDVRVVSRDAEERLHVVVKADDEGQTIVNQFMIDNGFAVIDDAISNGY